MHQTAFEEHTLDKLSIYEKYLKSALPLFMMRPDINQINIMDFFCGSGSDVNGVPGSPLRAIESVRNDHLVLYEQGTHLATLAVGVFSPHFGHAQISCVKQNLFLTIIVHKLQCAENQLFHLATNIAATLLVTAPQI